MATIFLNKRNLLLEAEPQPRLLGLLAKGLVLDDAIARDKAVINAESPPPAVTPPPPAPADIASDSALGRVRETAAVARRLEVAPSVEFVNVARQTKDRFFVGGLRLLADAGYALEDIAITGFEIDRTPAPTQTTPKPPLVRLPIEDAADLLALYTTNRNEKIVDDDDDPYLKTEEQTEARFFAFGLNAVDSTVRFLRSVETRTDDYRRLLADAQAARAALAEAAGRLAAEIGQLDTQLAEVRHDLAVARSLRAEEEQRVARVVARRRAVLTEHVPYLAFRRPLVTRTLEDSPVLAAEPALVDDPVPAARAQTDELLPELQQMVDTLRDLPARWFRKAAPLFDRFDRALSIDRLAAVTFERVQLLVQGGGRAIDFESDGGKAAQQLRRSFDGQAERVLKLAQAGRGLLAGAQAASARGALDAVRGIASIADLIRAAPPTRDVSLAAAGLLDDLGNVAHALYEAFSAVPPATRLRWAELFSELDPRVPLRQLTVLPQYGDESTGVDFIQWRQMQKLVDWLFLQVEPQDDAVAAINDLVRVCLLLAAHAPVRRIISARIRRPVPARLDARLELELDPRIARIGMQVLVHAPAGGTVVARAVVEDLGAAGGVARITQVLAVQPVTIDAGHRVQLQAGPALSTPGAARIDQAQADGRAVQAQVQSALRQDALGGRTLRAAGGKLGAALR